MTSTPELQQYYASWESRIGYRFLLGGTRHFGYYAKSSSRPWPVGSALVKMEGQLFEALQCPRGSRVLDAGCGVGHVAMYMAKRGQYKVDCIDVVPRHVDWAKKNVRDAKMEDVIRVEKGDYHRLEGYKDGSFDGIYTMETLVHSTDPTNALKGFYRILKPGGRIALHEYHFHSMNTAPTDVKESAEKIIRHAAMPALARFTMADVLRRHLQKVGFQDVCIRDISSHIMPMLRLFYYLARIPYLIFKRRGMEHHFINTFVAVKCWQGREFWSYVQVTGRKATESDFDQGRTSSALVMVTGRDKDSAEESKHRVVKRRR
ncbi:methyltransferase type 11 [Viridothelium virens]|uniref:Methyltransferase type 11 n=1 Tax=Viridothelium virens TaxID=1048519 RepID=A0A6A6HL71_VIRVR|nr:methyltransferase type 11 [Viridothelium virens]